jgi:hypothetical protein
MIYMRSATATRNLDVAMECERMYDHFNRRLFDDILATPDFIVDTRKRGFHYEPPRRILVGLGSKPDLSELSLDLLRQMIYQRNWMLGRQDHTSNQYHNHLFAQTAVSIGLYVCKHPTRGFSILSWDAPSIPEPYSPQADMVEFLERTINRLQTDLVEALDQRVDDERSGRKTYQLKYVCGCPHKYNSIRSGRRPGGKHPLNSKCLDCGQHYRVEE